MTRRRVLLLVSLAVLALAAAGCGGGGGKKSATSTTKSAKGCSAKLTPTAVATVCNAAITKAQFDDVVQQAKRNYKLQKRAFPAVGSPDYQTLVGQIVSFLVQRSEFAQKAADMGVKVTDKDIANRLNLSLHTIETHRWRIMEKLDLHSIPELTKYALREGLASLDIITNTQ